MLNGFAGATGIATGVPYSEAKLGFKSLRIGQTDITDFNLDGTTDASDLAILMENMNLGLTGTATLFEGDIDNDRDVDADDLALFGGAADFTKDGKVDGDDFLIWQQNFNMSGTSNTGDANGDGVVNGDDFLIWQADFGFGVDAGGGSAAVPEPAGIALLLAAVAGLLARRNRR